MVVAVADRSRPLALRARAASNLAAASTSRRACAEAAAAAGAAAAATRLVADATRAGDEGAADAAAALVAAVSGDAGASGGRETIKLREGLPPVIVVQASLADGLGARLWAAAPALVSVLAGRRKLSSLPVPALANARVLELGCGTAAVGLAAALLGAASVAATDGEAAALQAARASAAATLGEPDGADCWSWKRSVTLHTLAWGEAAGEEGGARSACAGPSTPPCPACDDAPPLAPGPFDVVLGADVLYDLAGAAALGREVAARLAPTGVALLACPVRDAALLATFLASADSAGLTVSLERADWPLAGRAGVVGAGGAAGYEGGFQFARVTWRQDEGAWEP
jgi:SAM-dependent methyltransferase